LTLKAYKYIFISAICLWVNLAISQSVLLKNYGVKDGLPSSEVYHVMQDSKGYMWFATDHGVSRFDGYKFKNFTRENGLADNVIFECIEDYKGRIWFRSYSGRLSYYSKDSIYALKINDSINKLLNGATIISMSIDSTDCLYLGAQFSLPGIIKIDMNNGQKLSIIKVPDKVTYVATIDKSLPIIGCNADPVVSFHARILTGRVNIQSQNFQKTQEWDWDEIPFNHSSVHDIVMKLPDGKTVFTRSGKFVIMKDTSIYFEHTFPTDIIKVSLTSNKALWIIRQNEAPEYYENGKLIIPKQLYFLKNAALSSIASDKENGLWLTTLTNGVIYIRSQNFKAWRQDEGLPWKSVKKLQKLSDTTFAIFSESSPTFSIFKHDSIYNHTFPDYTPGSSITQIFNSPYHATWLGSTAEIYSFSNLKEFKQNYLLNKKITANDMIRNADSTVWVNSFSRLILLRQTGNTLYFLKNIPFYCKIFSIVKDSFEHIYIGTMKGLWIMKGDSLQYLGSNFPELKNCIEDIALGKQGQIYLATRDNGVLIFNKAKITRVNTKNGMASNLTRCICADHYGNLWIGSNEGISHLSINPSDNVPVIKNVNKEYINEVNSILCMGDTVYAGTTNGLISFSMKKLESNRTPPPVYITDVKINNKKKALGQNIDLTYDENYLSINFIGLTYKDAGNTTYRYKMEGIDTGWVYTKNTDVQYPKLSPGSYTFRVAAMNNDGVWSTQAAFLSLHISPPLWATWWAWASYILLIAGFIYWRFKVVETRAKRSAELNKQLISMELRELKKQIDPHFLFNNLNTLTHLVEVKSDDAPEFVEELSKYYRYSLQFRNSEFTALDNEIKQAERYLHILKIRFGDHITTTWNIDHKYRQYLVATYSLQLLLENITKHNIVSDDKPLWIEVYTTDHDTLVVKNKLQLKNSSALSTGHGLKSIEQRYKLLTSKLPSITKSIDTFSVELPLISINEYEGNTS